MHRQSEVPSLVVPVSADDWADGPADAAVTLIEYADFECSDVLRLEPLVQEVRQRVGDDLRYVYRHFPLTRKHEHALIAAEVRERALARWWVACSD